MNLLCLLGHKWLKGKFGKYVFQKGNREKLYFYGTPFKCTRKNCDAEKFKHE